MARLHKVGFTHLTPCDDEDGIRLYVIADTETQVRDGIDERLNGGRWAGREDYDDSEMYLDRMLRLRGDMHDEDAVTDYRKAVAKETADDQFADTLYDWDEGVEINEFDADVLLRLGVAEDWTGGSFRYRVIPAHDTSRTTPTRARVIRALAAVRVWYLLPHWAQGAICNCPIDRLNRVQMEG